MTFLRYTLFADSERQIRIDKKCGINFEKNQQIQAQFGRGLAWMFLLKPMKESLIIEFVQ